MGLLDFCKKNKKNKRMASLKTKDNDHGVTGAVVANDNTYMGLAGSTTTGSGKGAKSGLTVTDVL